MNTVQTWLYLIGTPERARKLRARVDGLSSPPVEENFGKEAPQCPTTVLFGGKHSQRLYANPTIRPALDAWDSEQITKGDLRRYCLEIEKGRYSGEIYPYEGR